MASAQAKVTSAGKGGGHAGANDSAFTENIKSLIDSSNFAQAIQKLQKKADPKFKYLEAYCLYRSNKFDEALRILDGIHASFRTTAVDELRAQSFYRLGRYQEALSAYMQLFDVKSSADEFQTERICNALCVLTKLHEEDIPNVPDFAVPQSLKRYEVEFNSASLDIAKGHFSKAQQRLAKSLEFYKNEISAQQIPEDEAADEIAMLERQRDFAQSIASLKTEPGTPAPAAPTGKSKSKKGGDASKTAAAGQPTTADGPSSSSSLVTTADLDGLENNFWGQFVALKRKAAKVVAQPASKAAKSSSATSAVTAESGDVKKKKKKKADAASPATTGGGKAGVVAGKAAAGIKKKKRKIRLPKNYDPNVQPDPERWLPLHERSYYRGKKRKDKQSAIGKGTQGAVSSTQGDVTSTPVQSHYSPAAMPAAAGPRQQQGPMGGKKKSGAGSRRGGGKR